MPNKDEAIDKLIAEGFALPDGTILSTAIEEDADYAISEGYTDIGYRLQDYVRAAVVLETLALEASKKIKALEDDIAAIREEIIAITDDVCCGGCDTYCDNAARSIVEDNLHKAGVIEDPDIDGGLLG